MSHFSNHRLPRFLAVLACVCAWALAGAGLAAEPAEDATRRDDRFRKMVTNAKLSGHFTIDGDEEHAPPRHLQKEEYVITSASRLGTSDVWLLTSRIRYGKNDLTVPVPVTVKWAGDTPVMSLDKVGIPGLGTFSARVVLHEGRYAGTWIHDDVGGHMFGAITAMPEPPPERPAADRGNSQNKQSETRPGPSQRPSSP